MKRSGDPKEYDKYKQAQDLAIIKEKYKNKYEPIRAKAYKEKYDPKNLFNAEVQDRTSDVMRDNGRAWRSASAYQKSWVAKGAAANKMALQRAAKRKNK